MNNIVMVAHAGVEHVSETEANDHSGTTTTILVISAIALIALTLLIRYLNKKESPTTTDKKQ